MKKACSFIFLLAFLLTACGGTDVEAARSTAMAETIVIGNLENAVATAIAQTRTAFATQNAPTSTPTELPDTETPTPSVTPTPAAYAQVNVAANCRSGPGTVYDVVTQVKIGDTLQIIGKNPGGSWFQVWLPDETGNCWLNGTLMGISGNVEMIGLADIPPTPTPDFVATNNTAATLTAEPPKIRNTGGCTSYMIGLGTTTIQWCVTGITRSSNNELVVNVSWTAHLDSSYTVIHKDSDAGSLNMYITDNFGTRYNAYNWGGAAAELTVFYNGETKSGVFYFANVNPAATSFDFYDADQGVAIYRIEVLNP